MCYPVFISCRDLVSVSNYYLYFVEAVKILSLSSRKRNNYFGLCRNIYKNLYLRHDTRDVFISSSLLETYEILQFPTDC